MTPLGEAEIQIQIDNFNTMHSAIVMASLTFDLILGNDFLSKYDCNISYEKKTVSFGPCVIPFKNQINSSQGIQLFTIFKTIKFRNTKAVRIKPLSSTYVPIETFVGLENTDPSIYELEGSEQLLKHHGLFLGRCLVEIIENEGGVYIQNLEDEEKILPRNMVVAIGHSFNDDDDAIELISQLDVHKKAQPPDKMTVLTDEQIDKLKINPDLPKEERDKLVKLLKEYSDVFAWSHAQLGETDILKFKIDTQGANPISSPPYRCSAFERDEIKRQVNEFLLAGLITESNSAWASPAILVKKKNNTYRLCIDYRKLNKVIRKDVYPLARIDDILDSLRNATVFSGLDCFSGYYGIAVEEESRDVTAFVTPDGLFQWNVMPFGLSSAPSAFQRVMNIAFNNLLRNSVLIYLDDLVTFGHNFDNHLENLEKVLNRLRKHNIRLQPSKCYFAVSSLKLLGHIVSSDGIRVDHDKTKAMAEMPRPTTVKETRRFVGAANYFRRFIQNFSLLARPLVKLWKKDMKFMWGNEQETAWLTLRDKLVNAPVLTHHDPDLPQVIHTDASPNSGISAILMQVEPDGIERPVAYASRTLSKAESNYSASHAECLALCYAVRVFRPYIYGKPFTVKTDSHSLCFLKSVKDPTGRLMKFALKLQPYEYTIAYKAGKLHAHADALSRSCVDKGTPEDEEEDNEIPMTTILFNQLRTVDISAMQATDPTLVKIVDRLANTQKRSKREQKRLKNYHLKDGILYRQTSLDVEPLLAVPRDLRSILFNELHDNPTAGHLGFKKTFARFQKGFWWPKMATDIMAYCLSCPDCQSRKSPTLVQAGLHQPVKTYNIFERISLDLLGPFPKSNSGNVYVVACTEYATRFIFTKAIPNKTTEVTANFLFHDVIMRIGVVKVILSDRGNEFMSCVFTNLVKQLGSVKHTTCAYTPRCNGLIERANKTFATMISMYTSADHLDWDENLAQVTFAYNTSKHATTLFTPFFLLYGVDALLPIQNALLPDSNPSDRNDDITKLHEARKIALERIATSQENSRSKINQTRRDVTYAVGDKVRIFVPFRKKGLAEKLLHRQCGPYEILEQTSPVNYRVRLIAPTKSNKIPKSDIVPVSRMKPHYDRDDDNNWDLEEDEMPESPDPLTNNRPMTRAYAKRLAANSN